MGKLTRALIGLYLAVWYMVGMAYFCYPHLGYVFSSGKNKTEKNVTDTSGSIPGPENGPVAVTQIKNNSNAQKFTDSTAGKENVKDGSAKKKEEEDNDSKKKFGFTVIGVLIMGILGGTVTATKEFVDKTSERTPQWYFFAPFIGMMLGSFSFIAIRAGFIGLSADATPGEITNINLYLFVAVSAGLFSDAAYSKFQELANTIFATKETEEKKSTAGETKTPSPQQVRHNREITVYSTKDQHERMEAMQLRYTILVEKENLTLESADHKRRIIHDAYDEYSMILVARTSDSDEIVGTVRTLQWSRLPGKYLSGGIPKHLSDMNVVLPEIIAPAQCSYSSRLVTRRPNILGHYTIHETGDAIEGKSLRHSVATALCTEMYYLASCNNIKVDFITCGRDILSYYTKLGYRHLVSGVQNPDSHHESIILYLILDDKEHLEKTTSPFLEYCSPGEEDLALAKRYSKAMEEHRSRYTFVEST